jgi:hypothetical protein
VAWGAIGTPIVTLAAVSGLDQVTLSAMAGRQLPFVSILVPFWLVAAFVKMEGGTWKEVFEVWPAALVAGGTFALMQYYASGTQEFHLMTDVVSGVFSVICTALFLRFVWHPKTRFLLKADREALAQAGKSRRGDDRQHGVEVPVYGQGDNPCMAALGDPHRLLRIVGHAGIQGVPEQPLSQASSSRRLCWARLSAAPFRCPIGTCRRSTTWCSACRR